MSYLCPYRRVRTHWTSHVNMSRKRRRVVPGGAVSIMSKAGEPGKADAGKTPDVEQYLIKDPERFALNLAHMIEQAGKAASAWAEPREKGEIRDSVAEPMTDMVKTFSKVTEYWLSDPARALEAQTRLFAGYLTVWGNSVNRIGEGVEPAEAIAPERGDKRFN